MDFTFLLNINVLTFLMVFIVFGFWQVLKLILKKEIDPKIIVTVNGAVAVVYAVVVAGLIGGEFFELVIMAGAVFSAGSFYDLLKVYGAISSK